MRSVIHSPPDKLPMKSESSLIILGVFMTGICTHAQGTFQNLNFELANMSGYPVGTDGVPVAVGLPGWSAYYGTDNGGMRETAYIVYDALSLGGAGIVIWDATSGQANFVLQGTYSLNLQGSWYGPPTSAAVGQNGTIPTGSRSLRFYGQSVGNLLITFNGQPLPHSEIGAGPNYTIYGADISAFEGQSGQLLFTALPNGAALLDNIRFSTQPIPEPGVCALVGLGALFACKRRPTRWAARSNGQQLGYSVWSDE
jgi:hypothetical protein